MPLSSPVESPHRVGPVTESDTLPATIVFFNTGVKRVMEGSPVLGDLQALAARGVEMLACAVCLNYSGLKGKVAVGIISNMYAISETMFSAEHVVNLQKLSGGWPGPGTPSAQGKSPATSVVRRWA